MGRARTNPFREIVDVMSEMNRMRELGGSGYETGQEDQRRTHATAWVSPPTYSPGGGIS